MEILFLVLMVTIAHGAVISPQTPPKVSSNIKASLENLTTDKQRDSTSHPTVATSTESGVDTKVTERPVTIITVVVPTNFESYDMNKDEYVDLEELANVSSTNLLEASRAFNAGDLNRDGLLNWDEFTTFPWSLLTDSEDGLNDTLDTRDDSEDYGDGDEDDGDEDTDGEDDGNDDVTDNHIIDEDDDRLNDDDVINNDYDVVENSNNNAGSNEV